MSRLLRAALVGIAAGVVARILMRGVALVQGAKPGFDPGTSALIVGLFAVAAVGAGAGAMLLARSRPLSLLVAALALVPLWLPGSSIAVVEVSEHAKGPLAERFGVIALALMIVGCMVAAPLMGWRIGRRQEDPAE